MGLETAAMIGAGAAVAGAGTQAYSAHQNNKRAQRQEELDAQGRPAQLYDPTNPALKGLAGQQIGFLQQAYGGQNPYAAQTSPLQRQATDAVGNFLRQPSPEQRALQQAQPALGQLMNGSRQEQPQGGFQRLNFQGGVPEMGVQQFAAGANPYAQQAQTSTFQPQQPGGPPGAMTGGGHPTYAQYQQQLAGAGNQQVGFGRQAQQGMPQGMQPGAAQQPGGNMRSLDISRANVPQINAQGNGLAELQNPFTGMGATNPGQAVVDAARPQFDRNLTRANAQLGMSAPGRHSSAFVQQGIDLNSQALNDFNLFSAQQLQQGQQLQNQQQQQALNFMLGARGYAQTGYDNAANRALTAGQSNAQNYLTAHGLQQQGNLGARGLEQDLYTQMGAQGLQGRGLDIQSQLGNRGLDAQFQGLGQDFFLGNQRLGLDSHTAGQQAMLQSRGLAQQAYGQQQQLGLDALSQYQNAMLAQRGQSINALDSLRNAQLGAMGQQLTADGQGQQFALGAAELQQRGQLGGLQALGQLSGQAGASSFDRALSAGQFGLQQTQQNVNPLLQLQLAGLQYGMPSDLNAIVGASSINGMGGGGMPMGGQGGPGSYTNYDPYSQLPSAMNGGLQQGPDGVWRVGGGGQAPNQFQGQAMGAPQQPAAGTGFTSLGSHDADMGVAGALSAYGMNPGAFANNPSINGQQIMTQHKDAHGNIVAVLADGSQVPISDFMF